MIKSFSCKNFKNVQAEDVECAPINLLIGPNNGGKSNFLQALSFCSRLFSSTDGNSPFLAEIKRNGGINILRQDADSREISLGWKIPVTGKMLDYRMAFEVGESIKESHLTKESLDEVQLDGSVRNIFHGVSVEGKWYPRKEGESIIAYSDYVRVKDPILFRDSLNRIPFNNTPLILLPMFQELQTYFWKFYTFSSSFFDYAKICQPQIGDTEERTLLADGGNFLNVYQTAASLDNTFEDRFARNVRQLIDGLKSISVESGLGKIEMRLHFGGGDYWLSEVSDGTVEALVLALLVSLPSEMAPSVLAIDEPEVNLHPAWQSRLARQIQTSGSFQQCFISTHSPDFLDAFTEGFCRGDVQILVFGSKGSRKVETLDREKLEPELAKGWMLGDLYRVNDPLIGGWPY